MTTSTASGRPERTEAETAKRPQRRLLVINSNTSTALSELLTSHAQRTAGPEVAVRTVTARFGARYVMDEASYAVAAHATLDAWACALAQSEQAPDAVLIGCFGDPALAALRSSSPAPVTGLAEAAFIAAAPYGRFAVVTGGLAWVSILDKLAQSSSHADQLAVVRAVALNGDELAANPDHAHRLLVRACNDVVAEFGVQAIILGGAGIAGVAGAIQPAVAVPLIDSVEVGVRWALRQPQDPGHRTAPGFDVAWHRLSPEMTQLGSPTHKTRTPCRREQPDGQ